MARLEIEIIDKVDNSLVNRIKELNNAISELQKTQKNSASGGNSMKDALASERLEGQKLSNEYRRLRNEITQINLEKKKGVAATTAAAGSVVALRERLRELTKIYDNLSQSAREGAKVQSNLVPEIQRIQSALSGAEQATGRFQRQVGNYAVGARSATGVTMEFNRIIQDLPFGMMGIGNNIQQLTANWQSYVASSRAAAAATGQTVSTMGLLRGVMTSMLTPANLLTLGIAAITSGIVVWQRWQQKKNKELKDGKEATVDYAKSLDNLQRAQYNAVRSSGEEINKLQTLYAISNDTTLATEKRKQALDELQKTYPSVFKSLNLETIGTKEAAAGYKELTESILANARAQAARSMVAEKGAELLALELQNDAIKENIKNLEEQAKAQARVTDAASSGVTGGVSESIASGAARRELQTQSEISKEKENQAKLNEEINNKQAEILKLNSYVLENEKQINKELLKGADSRGNAESALKKYQTALEKLNEITLRNAAKVGGEDEFDAIKEEYRRLGNEAAKAFSEMLASGVNQDEARAAFKNATETLALQQAIAIRKVYEKLEEEHDKRIEKEREKFDALLAANEGFEKQRLRIIEKAQKEAAELRKGGANEEALNAENAALAALAENMRKQLEATEEYSNVTKAIEQAGVLSARAALENGRKVMTNLIKGMSNAPEAVKNKLIKETNDFFGEAISAASIKEFELFADLAQGFAGLADSALDFDNTLKGALDTIGKMVMQTSNLLRTIGQAANSAKLLKLGEGASIAGAVLGVFGSIAGAIQAREQARIAEQQERAAEANRMQIKAIESVTNSLKRQLDIIESIYGVERVKSWEKAADDSAKSVSKSLGELGNIIVNSGDAGRWVDDLRKRGFDTIDEVNDEIARLEKRIKNNRWNPFVDTGKDLVRVTELRTFKQAFEKGIVEQYELAWGKIEDITVEGADQVRRDIEAGKFDEVTASQLEAVIEQWEIFRDAQRRILAEITGTSVDSLIGDVSSIFFDSGENAAEAWGEGFSKIMENYLRNQFNREFLEKRMESFFDTFAGYAESGGGLDSSERAELQRLWKQVEEEGNAKLEELKAILGHDFSSGGADSSTGGGGIASQISRAITEDTALRLEGIWRGMYDMQRLEVDLMREMVAELASRASAVNGGGAISPEILASMRSVAESSERTANNTEVLHDIHDVLIETQLGVSQVVKNTGQQTSRDLGV